MHKIDPILIELGLAVPIDSIQPPDRLIKDHTEVDLSVTKRSLAYYGQVKPIAVNAETNVIIAGVGRWMAAKQLGWTDIAALKLTMKPEDARGYAIVDNQSSALSHFNVHNLVAELIELDQVQFNTDMTGFQQADLSSLLLEQTPEDLESLLQEIDVSVALEHPIWAVIRTGKENWESLEAALIQLELQGIKVERSYAK